MNKIAELSQKGKQLQRRVSRLGFDEGKHPRVPSGSGKGGEFAPSGGASGSGSPLRAIQDYDKKFDSWFTKVRDLLGKDMSLPALLKDLRKEDPAGAYDSGQSPAEFIKGIGKL